VQTCALPICTRASAEVQRTEIARRLGDVRLELGRLDGDLALAAERLANAAARRLRANDERGQMETRRQQAQRDHDAADAERKTAQLERERIATDLAGRAQTEQEVRLQLGDQRQAVRQLEEDLQRRAQILKSLEGDLSSLREQASVVSGRRQDLQAELDVAERRRAEAVSNAEKLSAEAKRTSAEAERGRHLLAETRRREALGRADRRAAEESQAQLTTRRQALEELERDRVGLAPGAAALLAAKSRFGGAVLGPLSDFLRAGREDAEIAERLLGEWVHAVLVSDSAALEAIQDWHASEQPGMIALLPIDSGP